MGTLTEVEGQEPTRWATSTTAFWRRRQSLIAVVVLTVVYLLTAPGTRSEAEDALHGCAVRPRRAVPLPGRPSTGWTRVCA
jgi:hypothetical protein